MMSTEAADKDTWRRSDDDGTQAARHEDTGDQMMMVQPPDMRIPGGDQMMMVHGQAAGHEDTWRRSDDDGTRAGSRT